jgi:hypothetical protein
MAIKPKKIISSRGESGVGAGSGRGSSGGGGLTGSKKVTPKVTPKKATPKKKDYSANEKALNDAVSRILNGPWRTDL